MAARAQPPRTPFERDARAALGSGRSSLPLLPPEEGPDPRRLVLVQLVVDLPRSGWMYRMSTRYPELKFEITNSMAVPDDRIIVHFEMHGPGAEHHLSLFERDPDIARVEQLSTLGRPRSYRILCEKTPMFRVYERLQVLVCYPRWVENGRYSCRVIDSLERVRRVVDGLAEVCPKVELVRLRYNALGGSVPLLTPPQHALFRAALEAGYFDVPRKLSLGELAHQVRRSKSSVSATLARVEKKLAESAAIQGM